MKKLSIPAYISLDREYLPGLGSKELPKFLIAAVPGLTVTVISWFAIPDPIVKLMVMFFGLGYLMCCYLLFAKVDNRQSIYTFLHRFHRYRTSQQKFFYKQEKEVIRYADENKPVGAGLPECGSH